MHFPTLLSTVRWPYNPKKPSTLLPFTEAFHNCNSKQDKLHWGKVDFLIETERELSILILPVNHRLLSLVSFSMFENS